MHNSSTSNIAILAYHQPTYTYSCEGYRNVVATSIREAAEIFAGRLTRKIYGEKGVVCILNMTSYNPEYHVVTYSAFVGFAPKDEPNSVQGRDEELTVYRI